MDVDAWMSSVVDVLGFGVGRPGGAVRDSSRLVTSCRCGCWAAGEETVAPGFLMGLAAPRWWYLPRSGTSPN